MAMAEEEKQAAAEAAPEADADEDDSFEKRLEQLETIVNELEEGTRGLDESLKLYEQGIKAYRACQKQLSDAETKIRVLVETMEGELREEPFEPPQQ
jgi:exodeoxyribonuclease VII small subunit